MAERHYVTPGRVVHARGCPALAGARTASPWTPDVARERDRRCQTCFPAVLISGAD